MKTFKYFLFAGILASALLTSCRETDEMLSTDQPTTAADTQVNTVEEGPKDPPKDPPKDRDNWRISIEK